MSASTKLSNSVKALCYLAEEYPNARNSKQISNRVGVNASKLRKLLSLLSQSGIVASNKGVSGGFYLTKKTKEINLQQIYCAIEDRKAFHLDVNSKNGEHKDETKSYNNYFSKLFTDIQIDIEKKMENISLSSLMNDIKNKDIR